MNKEKDIELKSPAVQEILGRPPRWIIRWGITVIVIIIGGIIVGSCFFNYPEIISAPIVVTTENLPVNIVAKTTGRIDTLLVQEKQPVEKNQLLAVIENPARFEDVMFLYEQVNERTSGQVNERTSGQDDDSSLVYSSSRPLQLGNLQPVYQQFIKTVEDYHYFLKTDYHRKKIKVIEKQIEVQTTILAQSSRQLALMEEQNEIAKKLFDIDSIQAVNRLVPLIEYDKAKSALLQSRQNYESAKSNSENQKMAILQLEHTVFDLEQQRAEQLTQLRIALAGAYDQLQAELKLWEQTYLFHSPIKGTITFTNYWQPNQNLTAGETLLTIVPADSTHITGKIFLPTQGAGKVKVGQTVNIKFDNFPYMEYGMVKVIIKNIALVPVMQNNVRNYVLEVEFHDNLTTNYGKTLTFSQEMQGTADIITEDLRLIERFLQPIRALINR